MLAETQAKKYLMDIVESSPPLLVLMRAMNRLTPFSLPHLAKFAPDAKEEAGKIPSIGLRIENRTWDSPTTRTN